ncbi:MAG: transglutaminase domain-containing protein, partial [Clostridia bacterium]|nr:transglutaminase domain-containing protein [Clostridia bacterium]
MKKITSLFLALLMICYGVFTVPVLAADNNENPEPSNGSESTETLPSFSSVNSAVSFIRSEMTSRVEEFQFVYTGKTKLTAETIFAYSGSEADEGDYLKFNLSDFLLIPEGEVISCSAAYHTDAQQEEAIDAKVNEIVGSVDAAGMTDYQKAVFVYDYLCDNVEYLDDANSISVYTAYGALCGGKAVCQGYALAYYRMARALGLNCRMIVGSLSEEGNEVPHAWNAVKLGDSWYYVDTTNGAGAQSDEPHDRYVCFMAPLDNGIYQLNIAFEEEDQSEEDGSAEID